MGEVLAYETVVERHGGVVDTCDVSKFGVVFMNVSFGCSADQERRSRACNL